MRMELENLAICGKSYRDNAQVEFLAERFS
ncbi:MAG: hypothetical protein JWM16_2117 [Verrucomicrobiales bacterium]|nr:hypothetical protein [Verrucomicrobiales bacterium]